MKTVTSTSTAHVEDNKDPNATVRALLAVLRFHGMPAESGQLEHVLGEHPSPADIVRCLRERGLKAKLAKLDARRLSAAPLPAIAVLRDAEFVALGRVDEERVLLVDPETQRPKIQPRADFDAHWSGEIILVTRRASLGDLGRRFDITWFFWCGAEVSLDPG